MGVVKLRTRTKQGTLIQVPVDLVRSHGYIHLVGLPFNMKDEIKACMSEPKWDVDRRLWRIKDDDRTRFQLSLLTGSSDPYANWDLDLVNYEYERPLMTHQKLMTDWALTYRRIILAAEMGVGKTLSMIEIMERANLPEGSEWWFVAPKSGLIAVEIEFAKWELKLQPITMTYEGLLKRMKKWSPGEPVPQGLIFDEFSRCKNSRTQRARACKVVADAARAQHGWDCYIIGSSGSCAPKAPIDWWMLAEIVQPGFLRENDVKTFEWRLGIFEKQEIDGTKFNKRVAWRDNELRCNVCGEFKNEFELDDEGNWTGGFTDQPTHTDELGIQSKDHEWEESINEVELLTNRLSGLVLPLFKKDCLDLTELDYREVDCKPTASIKRAARAIAGSATSTIQALTWLRALSDGFQYSIKETDKTVTCKVCKGTGIYSDWEEGDEEWKYSKEAATCEYCGGEGVVPETLREAKYYKGPKEKELIKCLDECEEHERIVIAAGFQASVDLCERACHRKGWDVVHIDGRGWKIKRQDGSLVKRGIKPMDYWSNHEGKVAIVMHAESGGMGLTLTEAYMIVVYSNDFKPENRIQLVNRIHRPGMTRGGIIVDLLHLGTDRKILNVLKDNHRLEKMSLGDLRKALE